MLSSSRHSADSENAIRTTDGAQPIQAVVFDAVGTVMYPDPGVAEAYQQTIQQHCGVLIGADAVAKAVQNALIQRSAGGDFRTNEDSERQFWAELVRELCPDPSAFQPCFDDLFAQFASADNWRCFPDVQEAFRALHTTGVTLVIASNFDRRLNSVCDGLPELSDVPHRIISSVVGWRKPAAEFFRAVVTTLNVPANRILMVGDDLTNDIQGALAAGMQAAWICRDSTTAKKVPCGAERIESLQQLAELVRAASDVGPSAKESHGA